MLNESFWKDVKVEDTLKGYSRINNGLVILENHRVILRRDYARLKEKVKIISGGGSGHEPAFAGFVGPGMLTAAVYGEIFTPPTSNDIVQTIRQLCQEDKKGILMIVGNNIGDRLAFGVAYERALKENYQVKMITMGDNNSSFVENSKESSSGLILLYKFAGALSEEYLCLDKLYEQCLQYANQIKSSNLLFKSYQVFNHKTKMTWNANEACLGMGLQGEPCGKIFPISNLTEAVELILNPLKEFIIKDNTEEEQLNEEYPSKKSKKFQKEKDVKINHSLENMTFDNLQNEPIILLINYLKGSQGYEINVFVDRLMDYLDSYKVNILRLVTGSLYTSLDAHGYTISVLPADSNTIRLLDAPCSAPNWPRILCATCLDPTVPPEAKLPLFETPIHLEPLIEGDGPSVNDRTARIIRAMLICAVDACLSCDIQIKNLDIESQGKQGLALTTVILKFKEALQKDELDTKYPKKMLKQILSIFRSESTGFYGILYALMIGI